MFGLNRGRHLTYLSYATRKTNQPYPNTMDLVNRLKYYLEENKIAISQFADKCRIPRPTLSQILNGRNKKISDELISKIHEAYPDLSVLWLMFGEGDMVTNANTRTSEPENTSADTSSAYQNPENQLYTESADNKQPISPNYSEKSFCPNDEQNPTESAQNAPQASYGSSPLPAAHSNPGQYPRTTSAGELDFAGEYNATTPYDSFEQPSSIFNQTAQTTQEIEAGSNPRQADRTGEIHATNLSEIPSAETFRKSVCEAESIIFTNTPPEDQQPAESPNTAIDNSYSSFQEKGNDSRQTAQSGSGTLSVPTLAGKTITNIVVFYSDNSFQSFSPTPS